MKKTIITTIQMVGAICAFGQTRADYPPFSKDKAPPKNAPNILLVLIDDAGFGQFSVTGGPIESPAMDALHSRGILYNRFHTVGMSSPTRAALLTGRNSHAVSAGSITEMATGHPGYTSMIPSSAATIGEVLRQNGYATAWIGKNHNTPVFECSPNGPFDRWPNGLGFDYFYGLMGADGNQLLPTLYENTNPVKIQPGADYSMSKDFADKAINHIKQIRSVNPDQPWFCYLAPAATHAPHQTPLNRRNNYNGRFNIGWDSLRTEILQNQVEKGIVPQGTHLAAKPAALPDWDTISDTNKRQYIRMMELFADYSREVDAEMGRVVEYVQSLPNSENTLIIWIIGDNGASAEGGFGGSINELLSVNEKPKSEALDSILMSELGSEKHFNHFPIGWAQAMNTPFPWAKQVSSHLGAVRNPMIISWPAKIKSEKRIHNHYSHVIDIYPTILEAAGIIKCDTVNGITQMPVHGTSLCPTFSNEVSKVSRRQYYEMLGNRAIYDSGYLASYFSAAPWGEAKADSSSYITKWELYNLDVDFSQSENIAKNDIVKLKQLMNIWTEEAEKYSVLPVDISKSDRFSDQKTHRPNPTNGKSEFVYTTRLTHLAESTAPDIKNKSFEIIADIKFGKETNSGMIYTQGGNTGGCALYLRGGYSVFVYNYLDIERYVFTSTAKIPDSATMVVQFEYDGEQPGSGGSVKLYVNDKEIKLNGEKIESSATTPIKKNRIARTVPIRFSNEEGQDIGEDNGTPVDNSYAPPFRFGGEIKKLTIKLNK